MSCYSCEKETDERYIIDMEGEEYCSEDCLEKYMEEQDLTCDPHPYEDTYLMLRRAYIDLLDNWEETLNKKTVYLERAVDEILEEIDELIDDESDFIDAEGDDGPYSWEIYQYTLKLRELQKCIFAWRPNRKMLYWVDGSIEDYRVSDEQQEEIYNRICTDLYLDGYEEFILYVIKNHQHPWRDRFNYVFDNEEMANEAFEILKPYCGKRGVELSIVESYKCEAHCGDILEADADTYINGWFYCYSCKKSGDHGIFTPQEWEDDLEYYEEHEEERQVVIYEFWDWCYSYKKKVKRTCRVLEVEVPLWAE